MATGQTAKPAVNDWQTVPPSVWSGAPTFHLETSNVPTPTKAYAEGVSTPPNGGNISDVNNPEPNDSEPNDWQTVGEAPQPTLAQQQAWSKKNSGGSISAYTPSVMDRVRGVVANSIIGRDLEESAPAVSQFLHLTPSETVNSPTYQSDKNQLLAPQFLMPNNPRTHLAGITKGLLTGAGKLTSGNSMATTAALAATGGLAAPLAPLATGLRLGLGGVGAYGVGGDLFHAGGSYLNGDSAAGDEQLGEALPNAALMLPGLAKPIESIGEATKGAGVSLMDSYLKAGKKAYRYDAEPGRGILEQGPGTSIGFTREGFAQGVNAAKDRVGAQIPDIIDNSTAQIPRATLRGGMDAILQNKTNVLRGIGGKEANIPPLQDLRNTASSLVDTPGYASPREVYNAKKNLDDNINWGRDVDAKDATENNMRREMRSEISGQLYDAVPELAEPSRQYGDLSSASKLANDRTYDRNGSVFNPIRIASMIGADALAQGTTHNSGLAAGVGLATGMLPEVAKLPIVKTGGATALYQLGRGIAATGRGLGAIQPFGRSVSIPEAADESPYAQPGEHESQRFSQGAPPNGGYRSTTVTPEIIRPDAISRSKFGLGATGRAGTMLRPIGALPAPVIPPPEATPYSFVNPNRQLPTAIPARAPETLLNSIGTRAYTLPDSLLTNLFEGDGSEAEKAAALRQANLGSYGGLVPSRLLAPPSLNPEISAPTPTRSQSQPRKFRGLRKKGEQ